MMAEATDRVSSGSVVSEVEACGALGDFAAINPVVPTTYQQPKVRCRAESSRQNSCLPQLKMSTCFSS